MSAREELIRDVNDGMSVSVAAERHGVARSCAYKWVGRYREDPVHGLEERSRVPERSPKRTAQPVVDELLKLKWKHPDYGPAKLALMLNERHGKHVLAVSTAGQVLSQHGQVQKRRARERSAGPITHGPFQVAGAGDTMTTDYKGQFRMGNGVLCYPLTIADPFSRYVLAIDALPSTNMEGARKGFERVFREYGIPRQIISDNGTPFCARNALGGLTQLSRWFIELGIQPIQIDVGHPEQNGIHERMHRTLKAWIRRHPQLKQVPSAAVLQCLPEGVQPRAPASGSGTEDSGQRVSVVSPILLTSEEAPVRHADGRSLGPFERLYQMGRRRAIPQ